MGKKIPVVCLLISQKIKDDMDMFAIERGLKNAQALLIQGGVEYIRRRIPKEPVTELHKRLSRYVNGY